MERIHETATYVLNSTGFVPTLIALSLAPARSLSAWLAVQSLDAPTKVDEATMKTERRKTRLRGLAFLVFFFGVEITLLSSSVNEDLCDMFFRAIVGSLFQLSCFVAAADLLRAGRWVAYRRPNGMLAWRIAPGTVSKVKVGLAAVLSTAVNVLAYYTEYRTFAVLVSAALLYRFTSQGLMRSVSMRGACIFLLSWLAFTFVFSGLVVMALLKSGILDDQANVSSAAPLEDGEVRILMIDQNPPRPVSIMSPQVERYVQLIMPFSMNAGPAFLIALCYRFDFARHLSLTGNSSPSLETVDAPVKKPHYTRGVLVPTVAPRAHSKPYFTAALGSWLIAQALIASLITFVDMPAGILEGSTYDLMVLTLAIPLMVVGLVCTAMVRGEMREMWRYAEKWSPSKEEMKQLAAEAQEDVDGMTDEILPYADEEKVELAPPYPVDVKA